MIHKEIIEAIKNNNISLLTSLLKKSKINPSINDNIYFRTAIFNKHTNIVKSLLEYPLVDPTDCDNWAVQYSSDLGEFETIKVLLNDRSEFYNIVELFWNDKRVKNTLQNDHFDLYNKLMSKEIENKVSEF